MKSQYIIGTGYMTNVHLLKHNDKFYIAGNLPRFVKNKSYLRQLLSIPGVDHDFTFCSSPYEHELLYGIKKAEDVIYIEL